MFLVWLNLRVYDVCVSRVSNRPGLILNFPFLIIRVSVFIWFEFQYDFFLLYGYPAFRSPPLSEARPGEETRKLIDR